MNFVYHIIVKMFHLSLACRAHASRLTVLPLQNMVQVTFGGLVADDVLAQTVHILEQCGSTYVGETTHLDQLVDAVTTMMGREWAVQERMEQANTALDELGIINGVLHDQAFTDIQLTLAFPTTLQYLQYLVLSTDDENPLMLLVGAVTQGEQPLSIPLKRSGTLDQLQIAYVAADPYPRLRTDLWVRCPPNPLKQRLKEWTTSPAEDGQSIELSRRQIPGERPWGTLRSRMVAGSHHLRSATIALHLNIPGAQLQTVCTTVHDMYQRPLLLIERAVVTK